MIATQKNATTTPRTAPDTKNGVIFGARRKTICCGVSAWGSCNSAGGGVLSAIVPFILALVVRGYSQVWLQFDQWKEPRQICSLPGSNDAAGFHRVLPRQLPRDQR